MLDHLTLANVLAAVGDLLADSGQTVEVVANGGGGLLLLDLIERSTKDLDLIGVVIDDKIVNPVPLPRALSEAASNVGRLMKLPPDWLDDRSRLLDLGLPAGFFARTIRRDFGGLIIRLASRYDQICFKLYAAADDTPYGKHFADLKRLVPTVDELRSAAEWVVTHDNSEGFVQILDQVLAALGAKRSDA